MSDLDEEVFSAEQLAEMEEVVVVEVETASMLNAYVVMDNSESSSCSGKQDGACKSNIICDKSFKKIKTKGMFYSSV